MRLPSSERARWLLAVVVGCLVLAAFNIWWVATYRHGYPLDVDEAGYTMIGLNDYFGLEFHGLHGWWEAVQTQTPNAPLLPAITSLVLVFSPGVLQGFGVLIVFGALLTLATYGIGERLAGPRLGAIAALAVATSQGTFIFTREYIFALPTAAFLACAVYALLRSDAMRLRGWAIACGAAVGLMLLSRTMAIAFVPGVVVAAGLLVLTRRRDDLWPRLLNLGLAVLSGVLVAATWYWRNLSPVWDYLTNFGYGTQAQYYGESDSTLSWDRFKSVTNRMIQSDLLVPLAVLIFAGLVALGVLLFVRLRDSDDRRTELGRILGSNALAVFLVAAAGFAGLMTSQNGGNGFSYPIAILLSPLAVVALRRFQAATIPVALLVVAIAVVNIVAHSTVSDEMARARNVAVPLLGELPWVNGEEHAVSAVRVQVPGPLNHFASQDQGWTDADAELADLLQSEVEQGRVGLITFAMRNRVISTNSVGLASVLDHHVGLPLTQIVAEPTDTVANYRRQLTDPELGLPTALVTMSTEAGDFEPLVTQKKVEAAAKPLGFRLIHTIPLPDGRQARVWIKRPAAQAAPEPEPKKRHRSAAAPAAHGSK
jgi:4-amino-4-deoxy-L-arabinose transferase-like glycosyltransferase